MEKPGIVDSEAVWWKPHKVDIICDVTQVGQTLDFVTLRMTVKFRNVHWKWRLYTEVDIGVKFWTGTPIACNPSWMSLGGELVGNLLKSLALWNLFGRLQDTLLTYNNSIDWYNLYWRKFVKLCWI